MVTYRYTDMPGGAYATVAFGIGQLASYPILAFTAVRQIGEIMAACMMPAAPPPAPNEKSNLLLPAGAGPGKGPGGGGGGGGTSGTSSRAAAPAGGGGDGGGGAAGGGAAAVGDAPGLFYTERAAGVLWAVATTACAIAIPDVSSLLALVGASPRFLTRTSHAVPIALPIAL